MSFISNLSLSIVFFCAAFIATASAQTFHWRLAMSWPDGTPMFHNNVHRFASNVEKMSAGRMRITVDSPGKHKAPLGIFDMVRSGAYDTGHTASFFYKGKEPAAPSCTPPPIGTTPT